MAEDLSVLTRPAREPEEVVAYGTHVDQIADVRRGRAGAERRGDGAVRAFLGADPSTRPDVDPRQLSAPETPTTIIHGDRDDVVPISVTDSYVAAHPSVRVVPLPGAGHFAPIDPLSPSWEMVLEELRRLTQ